MGKRWNKGQQGHEVSQACSRSSFPFTGYTAHRPAFRPHIAPCQREKQPKLRGAFPPTTWCVHVYTLHVPRRPAGGGLSARGTPAREGSGDARPVEKSVLALRARWMVREGCTECMCCRVLTRTLEVRGVTSPAAPAPPPPMRLTLMVRSSVDTWRQGGWG
jgi:hypothetical protein